MALQFGHNVAVEYARFLYRFYIYVKTKKKQKKNVKTRFYGQEIALVFKEKHVVP
jgi:hypothetical protein